MTRPDLQALEAAIRQELIDQANHSTTEEYSPELDKMVPRKLIYIDGDIDCAKLAEAARSHLSQPPADESELDGWLPIESAPKDGTEIFGGQEYRNSRSGHLLGGFIDKCKFVSDDYTNGKWVSSSGFVQPTHWMPLPKPPKAHRAQIGG